MKNLINFKKNVGPMVDKLLDSCKELVISSTMSFEHKQYEESRRKLILVNQITSVLLQFLNYFNMGHRAKQVQVVHDKAIVLRKKIKKVTTS
jgi:hypothetical protein